MKINWVILLFAVLGASVGYGAETLQDRLKNLVEINSGSANKKGVLKVQSWIADELKKLQFDVQISEDQLLIGNYTGASSKTIVMVVHADTVFEPSSDFRDFKVTQDPKIATGPGVIDDKGGVIVALEGLRRFLQDHPKTFNFVFVASPSEELGSTGLIQKFQSISEKAWMLLSFEPTTDDGSLIESRKGNRWYQIKVTGKEAHAGKAHKDGVNACYALSSMLTSMSRLTDYKKDVTVSVGRMEGGKDKFNIVCGEAFAKVDTRFYTLSDREKLHAQIEKILKQTEVKGVRSEYVLADDCPPFSTSKESLLFLRKYLSIIEKVESRKVFAKKTGGAADANYFSRPGLMIIDGLGPQGGKIHTNEEFIDLPSLETRSEALKLFLSEIGK